MPRLSRDQRRAQLVRLGMQMVESRSFDEVSVDDVAEAAGISRSLLFHYFPTKRDFQVELARQAAADLLEHTAPDDELSPEERLASSVRAYIDYVDERRAAYLSLVRGAAGGDEAMRAVFDRTREQIAVWLLEGLGLPVEDVPPSLHLAARGWVAAVEEITVVWLREGSMDREQVIGLIETVTTALMTGLGSDLVNVGASDRSG